MTTVADLRRHLAERRARGGSALTGSAVALVPTMGALHEGHLSLIRAAAAEADTVVVSVFVNPLQFDDQLDLARYPRDLDHDAELAAAAGAAVLFTPDVREMYPPGFATTISVAGVTDTLEGEHRGRAHFDGVTTVVAKLFAMVGPEMAYFGQKDAQQVAVIRRLVADLNLPILIKVLPTIREPDGLAMSSRNVRLSIVERNRALALPAALAAARECWLAGRRDVGEIIGAAKKVLADRGVQPEYVALVDPHTFAPVWGDTAGVVLLALAAPVGQVRLIDNVLLQREPSERKA
nr:pantoate--beta-alanine ligase [Microlunatus panaciterrae]